MIAADAMMTWRRSKRERASGKDRACLAFDEAWLLGWALMVFTCYFLNDSRTHRIIPRIANIHHKKTGAFQYNQPGGRQIRNA
jgi:hypothetical protein